MNQAQIQAIASTILPFSYENEALIQLHKTSSGTAFFGQFKGNRLSQSDLRSQFFFCESESIWDSCSEDAKKYLFCDQRVFVQTGDDCWDIWKGTAENNPATGKVKTSAPVKIATGRTGLQQLLLDEFNNLQNQDKLSLPSIQSIQRIFYGAPGTGKSFQTDKIVKKIPDTIRVTFHPDSDYASFVGCYKPTMRSKKRIALVGKKFEEGDVSSLDESLQKDDVIVYEFVPQAFTKAYELAWRKMAECQEGEPPTPQFLVIEEINRGNCAQIFGDLFQLLDRDDKTGYSSYPVDPDADLAKHLHDWFRGGYVNGDGTKSPNVFEGLDAAAKTRKAGTDETDATWDDVLSGRKLVLPPNLHVWATMNTSDQSLFPMDSAFKRRWEWMYVPIRMPKTKEDGKTAWEDWTIRIPANAKVNKPAAEYAWNDFLEAINRKIGELTSAEDKKLGYFFVKCDSSGAIPLDAFVNKVVFYLWNDAFRAVGTEELGFEVADSEKKDSTEDKKKRSAQFEDFFQPNGDPDAECIREFLAKLDIKSKEKKTSAPTPPEPAAPEMTKTP